MGWLVRAIRMVTVSTMSLFLLTASMLCLCSEESCAVRRLIGHHSVRPERPSEPANLVPWHCLMLLPCPLNDFAAIGHSVSIQLWREPAANVVMRS